jgi:molybdenum cofactor cytidylyltransferase
VSAVAIVPAAGKAERFGSLKLLARVKDEPLVNWTLWSLLDAGVARIVVVTAPGADFSEVPLMADPRVRTTVNEDPARGMFSSIQAGLAVTSGDPFVILPADMPFVASSTVQEVLLACIRRNRVAIPVYQDQRGHPVAIPSSFRDALLLAPSETTLKHALSAAGAEPIEVVVSDSGILRDIDTPRDLQESS